MEKRPRLKLTLSSTDKSVVLINIVLLGLMWLVTIFVFTKLPDTIPVHFNFSGKPDDYGNKLTILILPLIATIIYFGFTQLIKHPHIFNYLTKITEENARRQYSIATRMMRFILLAVLFIFTIIIVVIYLTAINMVDGPGAWFIPLILSIFIIPLFIFIRESQKKD